MSLGKNAAFTMAAAVAQVIVTLATLPLYLSIIGIERYGVIVLTWLIFDYALLFNVGLDRAAIKFLSGHRSDWNKFSQVFWSAVIVVGIFALFGAVLLYFVLPRTLSDLLSVSPKLVAEVGRGYWVLAGLLVFSIVGTVIASLLQAHERFLELNISQFFGSLAFQLLPVLMGMLRSPSLEVVVISGAVGRALQVVIYIAYSYQNSYRTSAPKFSRRDALDMLRYGMWTSVSGVVSPIIVNLDRLLIGSLSGTAAVGVYSIPYNLVMRALIVPSSISSALFPRLSQVGEPDGRARTAKNVLLFLAFIYCLGLVFGAFFFETFIHLWIKNFVSPQSLTVGYILMIGIWFNGLAFVPYVWLQASGRPEVAAKVHIIEVLPYALVTFILVGQIGVVGAAMAWAARAFVDAAVLFRLARTPSRTIWLLLWPTVVVTCAVAFNFSRVRGGTVSLIVFSLLAVLVCIWFSVVAPSEVREKIKRFSARVRKILTR